MHQILIIIQVSQVIIQSSVYIQIKEILFGEFKMELRGMIIVRTSTMIQITMCGLVATFRETFMIKKQIGYSSYTNPFSIQRWKQHPKTRAAGCCRSCPANFWYDFGLLLTFAMAWLRIVSLKQFSIWNSFQT